MKLLQGNDQERFGTQISNDDAQSVIASNQPFSATQSGSRLNTLFAKFAPDIGADQALQIGVSYAQAQHYQQLLDDDDTALSGDELTLDGKQTFMGLDWVYKWDSAGEFGQGDIKITGEYLRLKKDMTVDALAWHGY
ncbi:MAG: hypothetical protein IPG70_03780 [Moraxellaceae bacterium]|nr:hypothetical protein [Moraxellaceae bacterium]